MALKDFQLDELLDLAQTGIERMRTPDYLNSAEGEVERLQGFSTLAMVMPYIRDDLLGKTEGSAS